VKTWAVVGKLTNGERLVAPPRDKVPGADTSAFQGLDAYVTLMERCWAQRPEERPGFREIIVQIRALLDAHTKAAAASGSGKTGAPLLTSDSGGSTAPASPLVAGGSSRAGAL
jgi:hypothetical protein